MQGHRGGCEKSNILSHTPWRKKMIYHIAVTQNRAPCAWRCRTPCEVGESGADDARGVFGTFGEIASFLCFLDHTQSGTPGLGCFSFFLIDTMRLLPNLEAPLVGHMGFETSR